MRPLHFHEEISGNCLVQIPKCPNWAHWAAKMVLSANILQTYRDTTLKPCSTTINAAIPIPWNCFDALISFRSQNAQIKPSGQQKWHFWPISWKRKEIRPWNHAPLQRWGYSASNSITGFWDLISSASQNAQIDPNWQTKWPLWLISWEREEIRP